MIKQSFLFNELLARKEFENANACKHKSFLTNKFKEEFSFQCTQNETTSYLHKNFLFHSNAQMLPKQTFFKRDFCIFIKTLKTMTKANLEKTMNKANLKIYKL